MENQKVINLLENTPNQPVNLEQKFGLKKIINHVELIKLIVKLNIKLQCQDQVSVIKAMHIYL